MKKEFVAAHLDVKAFAQDGASLSGQDPLQDYPRLVAESKGEPAGLSVNWSARGEARAQAGATDQLWLHLRAQVSLPLICQRCLGAVMIAVEVERPFRFVADEATAAALDDESEEDVLVLDRAFDLPALIEDELLMALPLVPRHESCPSEPRLAVADADFEAESEAKAHPFAALARLRGDKSN
ncbi:YceD family protein [Ramlibacter sp. 2FC]|uniref:YceD family protein n=1 Tax=Ramlibacter sp. 2FC TaxID=2502188 RepID=UPI0010F7FE34|nr:YceD family protein [Ramlibacter sp. 2FC]